MAAPIRLVAHPDHSWRGHLSYQVYDSSSGRLLAIGKDPLKASAQRLVELGLAHSGSLIDLRYADSNYSELCGVADALVNKEPLPAA